MASCMLGILREVWVRGLLEIKEWNPKSLIYIYEYIRFWIGKFWREATPFWASLCKYQSGIGFIHYKWTFLRDDKWQMESRWDQIFYMGKSCSFRLSGLQEFMLKWGWTMLNQPPKPTQNRPLLYGRSTKLTCCVCCLPDFGFLFWHVLRWFFVFNMETNPTPIPMMDTQMVLGFWGFGLHRINQHVLGSTSQIHTQMLKTKNIKKH